MTPLSCPVKSCGRVLEKSARTLFCSARHSFDIAKFDYVNLLTPQDKKSTDPGDSKEAVAARRRLFDRGFGVPLQTALLETVGEIGAGIGRYLDVGCGDGYFTETLAGKVDGETIGIDLSPAAVLAAAKRYGSALAENAVSHTYWIVANADRRLPIAHGSIDLLTSITSRRNPDEFRRLLAPNGILLFCVAAADDLSELRAAMMGDEVAVDRVGPAMTALSPFFSPIGRRTVRSRFSLDSAAIADISHSTYRGLRRSQNERIAELHAIDTTFSSEILVFRRRA